MPGRTLLRSVLCVALLVAGIATAPAQSGFLSEDVSFESAALRDGGVTV